MNKAEAVTAANRYSGITVKTSTGALYQIPDPSMIDERDPDAMVLGYRLNPRISGPFRKSSPGHRWLMVKNVELVE